MTIFLVAGVDEVGRGPLAGPVVTAAVILQHDIPGVTDSKLLSAKKRTYLAAIIEEQALAFAYGRAEVEEIDSLNIHHATLLAMQRAIDALGVQPHEVLIDGSFIPTSLCIPAKAIVKGDSLIAAIGAASILAKVKRDAEMDAWDKHYPQYGFSAHKGYPTASHRQALIEHGACPIHRRSYAPVAAVLNLPTAV